MHHHSFWPLLVHWAVCVGMPGRDVVCEHPSASTFVTRVVGNISGNWYHGRGACEEVMKEVSKCIKTLKKNGMWLVYFFFVSELAMKRQIRSLRGRGRWELGVRFPPTSSWDPVGNYQLHHLVSGKKKWEAIAGCSCMTYAGNVPFNFMWTAPARRRKDQAINKED